MAESKGKPVFNENLLRHSVINQIRIYRNRFSSQYGEPVLCFDSKMQWRKSIFKHYKQNRDLRGQKGDTFEWDKFFDFMNGIVCELEDNFPYKVMKCAGAEADDIIGVLTHEYRNKVGVMIISSDKDFAQLQINSKSVSQYSPYHKSILNIPDPVHTLYEQIVRGDSGDGVPNILSDDDVLITLGKRQKSITEKNVTAWYTPYLNSKLDSQFTDPKIRLNIARNIQMINLMYIPWEIKDRITTSFGFERVVKDRSRIMDYMTKHSLTNLISHITEF